LFLFSLDFSAINPYIYAWGALPKVFCQTTSSNSEIITKLIAKLIKSIRI